MLKSAKLENESNTAQLNLDLENAQNQVREAIIFYLSYFIISLGEGLARQIISYGNDFSSTSSGRR